MGHCFVVRKSGLWELSTDLQYISELADILNKRQGNAFYLIVDMRGMRVPQEVKSNNEKYPIFLDRRNQKGEIWLLDDFAQADHLLKYFKQVSFALKRTTSRDECVEWLAQYLSPSEADAVTTWLDEEKRQ
ncbi:hypothetical protein GCM10007391_25810 [Alteromonas halophila]|uniref:Uncharacterized protein n=2 Tax=Alteromonas halophila TaxID=516698 RepID=A0A918JMV6_9ALTE|nr:hypothetical protein GCM10007391_25810 [Alteromonas halophila]